MKKQIDDALSRCKHMLIRDEKAYRSIVLDYETGEGEREREREKRLNDWKDVDEGQESRS